MLWAHVALLEPRKADLHQRPVRHEQRYNSVSLVSSRLHEKISAALDAGHLVPLLCNAYRSGCEATRRFRDLHHQVTAE
jgi:hypothetical protein